MGKVKNYVKEETVNRINALLKKYKTKEAMKESEEFQNLETNFINGFERRNMEKIIDLCYNGETYDEIRYIIGGTNMPETNKKNKPIDNVNYDRDMDPVERESVFLISQQRVVEVDEPVQVIIGGVDDQNIVAEVDEPVQVIIGDVDNQNSVAEEAVNSDKEFHSDFINKMESDIENMFAKAEENSNQVKEIFKKMSVNAEVPAEPYKRQNFHLPTFIDSCEKKINEYEEKAKKLFERKTEKKTA